MLNWLLAKFGRVWCDRGRHIVKGWVGLNCGVSAGVYADWPLMMGKGERIVCDECMRADPRYIAVYGSRGGVPNDLKNLIPMQ